MLQPSQRCFRVWLGCSPFSGVCTKSDKLVQLLELVCVCTHTHAFQHLGVFLADIKSEKFPCEEHRPSLFGSCHALLCCAKATVFLSGHICGPLCSQAGCMGSPCAHCCAVHLVESLAVPAWPREVLTLCVCRRTFSLTGWSPGTSSRSSQWWLPQCPCTGYRQACGGVPHACVGHARVGPL